MFIRNDTPEVFFFFFFLPMFCCSGQFMNQGERVGTHGWGNRPLSYFNTAKLLSIFDELRSTYNFIEKMILLLQLFKKFST